MGFRDIFMHFFKVRVFIFFIFFISMPICHIVFHRCSCNYKVVRGLVVLRPVLDIILNRHQFEWSNYQC